MAEQKRSTKRYRTYGNVAYKPEFEQDPVRRSRRDQMNAAPARRQEPQRRPQPRPRRRPAVRPSVQVRAQTAISPFAVVGIFSVLACTLLLVVNCARLAVVNNDIVELRGTLSDLQDENRTLQAKSELVYDLEAIEAQFL